MFCAFHPKREMVPSLPLRFAVPETLMRLVRPWMPRADFWLDDAARLARIVLSRICSMSPAPKTGVGTRKLRFPFRNCCSKFSCEIDRTGDRGVRMTADHEERVDAAVPRAVALPLEADLPHGAVRRR